MLTLSERKTYDYTAIFAEKLEALKAADNYRYFLEVEKSAATFPEFTYQKSDGSRHKAVNWCSNDYLGQSTNPSVIAALNAAAVQSGVGSGGTRNISGTTTYHQSLEKATAQLVGKEAALIFNSAYLANQTTLNTLRKHIKGCIFISDAENHASIIEGLRGCRNEKHIFRHNDVQHLEEILCQLPRETPKIVVFESVYSMSGTIAPVSQIVKIAKKYGALTYCDEVHAVGLYGQNGGGLCLETTQKSNIQNPKPDLAVDFINGTFAKGFGVVGGFVASSALTMDFIRSHAEGFIFTTSLPPSVCAAIEASILYIADNQELIPHFHQNVQDLRSILRQQNVDFDGTPSHITRIVIGDSAECKRVAARLLSEFGIYLQPIVFPTVPKGEACLRVICSAKHTKPQMLALAKALKNVIV
jgi:5-aminolevulinate synthase